jgi:hypothetical protein
MSTLTSRTKIVATATAVATAVALSASVALAAESDAQQPAHQTLLFDATITQVHAEGPPPNEVGHLETASGVLADRRRLGQSVGSSSSAAGYRVPRTPTPARAAPAGDEQQTDVSPSPAPPTPTAPTAPGP